MSDEFKYWSTLIIYSIATYTMNFTLGYMLYTLAPVPAIIIGVCLVLQFLAKNTAITSLKESLSKQEEKK